MHADIDQLSLPELIDRLDDLEGRRTPVGWRPEDAVLRARIERRIMQLVCAQFDGADRRQTLRVPCDLDVKLRSRDRSIRTHARDLGVGGVFLDAPPDDFAVGTAVEIEVRGAGTDEHGLRVRGAVAWVSADPDRRGVGVAFANDDSERHERRLRRFLIELLRHRVDAP
ncbi:MAG: PilZ domain-containing protein [Deltaproteobacteria bacterium]|nr:MAG: PilZ domain-containing protein [Deltaproteobacteria bacterium]